MIAYKVTLPRHGKFMSPTMIGFFQESFVVAYEIGLKTYPRVLGSALFAFDTLGNAWDWCSGWTEDHPVIFSCESETHTWNDRVHYLPNLTTARDRSLTVYTYWEQENLDEVIGDQWPLPRGSVLCRWLRPVEKVYP